MIVAAAVVASAAVYPDLPAGIPTHWNLDGQIDGWSPRAWGVVMIPAMIVFLWALMRWLPSIDPRRQNYAKFSAAFEAIMITAMLVMLLVHAIILRAALGYPVHVERVIPVAIGILFIVVGNLLPRSRPNWFFGIRTPWTLSSDRVWEKTHRFGGRLFVIGGIVIAGAGVIGVSGTHWILVAVISACALGAVIYSYIEWRKEKQGSAAPSP
jgi:uncharacterized membrane protein